MTTVLKDCFLVTLTPPMAERGDLRIEGGAIAERGRTLRPLKGEETIDMEGKAVIPGMVCAHTHLYSTLARGMPPPARKPENFLGILRRVWWKLDRALDEESIYYSAVAGAMEALRCGTTLIVDHHASPNAIPGSLDIVQKALEDVGLRGVLCYEVTDRGGKKERDAGLRENGRFIAGHGSDTRYRGLVGAHASFTLGDASLRACAELARAYGTGVHIHVAEDACDVLDARRRSGGGLFRRLEKSGVALPGSIFAHGVHLAPGEMRSAGASGSWLVHNPRSNMNNGVGHAPLEHFTDRSALGTDGFPADMFEEARAGYFRGEESPARSGGKIPGLIGGGWKLASEIFGTVFGALESGAVADLAVLDYRPPAPMKSANVPSHFLFGFSASSVESVMVGGRWLLWNRGIPHMDEDTVMERARRAAERLWKRMV